MDIYGHILYINMYIYIYSYTKNFLPGYKLLTQKISKITKKTKNN